MDRLTLTGEQHVYKTNIFGFIQRLEVKMMSNTQNNTFVSTTSNITNWSSIDWKKAEKYVDKIQKRIYRAESEG